MSRLRWTLVTLLAASTVLFAVGAIAERSTTDSHATQTTAAGDEGAETHEEAREAGAAEPEEGHAEPAPGEASSEDERLLGVDLESTPLIVLAVLAGLSLATAAATRIGRLRAFLLAVAAIAVVWAALDLREVFHQLDESRGGVAVVAMAVAVLHLATAAVSVRLARNRVAAAS